MLDWREAKQCRDLARMAGDDAEEAYWSDILEEVFDFSETMRELDADYYAEHEYEDYSNEDTSDEWNPDDGLV